MLEESGFGATTSKVIRQQLDGDFRKQLPPECGAFTLGLCCSGLLTPGDVHPGDGDSLAACEKLSSTHLTHSHPLCSWSVW